MKPRGKVENPFDTWKEAALTSPNSLVFTLREEERVREREREWSSRRRRRYDEGGKRGGRERRGRIDKRRRDEIYDSTLTIRTLEESERE